ncbi:MAG: hypothetical protein IH840_09365 [Candidatus Heimdallarchaeota archaeon]|nr:hypothetical protein [Candidatus Heimdallarchaeota archaeon]
MRLFSKKIKKKATEKNYKTGKIADRYLASFRRVKRSKPIDHTAEHPPTQEAIDEVRQLLNKIIETGKSFKEYEEIRDEYLLLCVAELGNKRFSIFLDRGKVEFFEGEHEKKSPTIILPVSIKNLQFFLEYIEDREVDRQELFMMMRFFAIPVLKGLYDQRVLYLPGNKHKYKFDDFIQIEILPDEPIVGNGQVFDIKITVVNVDGQWLIFKGFEGDPDWRLTINMNTALEMWWLGTQKAKKHSKNPLKLRQISKDFLKLIDANTTYLRSDHQREFTEDLDLIEAEPEELEIDEYID